ncbi:MAG: alpha/beta fold hydrolase [Candidatus Eremiobacteraeota bacterium]|nr:alpha/beta fold hydrolase [Candidatus Eremiobacteraeota bacterium]
MSAAFAPSNGIQLCYETFGDRANPPLVLIMGLAAQMIVWDDEFCTLLAARGFWVVRFDNRDIGMSTRFPKARTPGLAELVFAQVTRIKFRVPYTLRDMAADTAGLMDALGIRSAHVVGASMGGAIAQEFAILYPARVRSLTSIMSSTGDPRLPGATRRALAALGKKVPLDREGYVREYVATWRVLAGEHFPFNAERTGRHGAASYDRGINPPAAARQLLAIIASGNRKKALRDVKAPTLVIHGTGDPLIPDEHGRDTARTVPGARLLLIEGMGHSFPREVWPRIIDAIVTHAEENR